MCMELGFFFVINLFLSNLFIDTDFCFVAYCIVCSNLKRIEDKGKEFGSTIKSGKLRWFVRETGKGFVFLFFFL